MRLAERLEVGHPYTRAEVSDLLGYAGTKALETGLAPTPRGQANILFLSGDRKAGQVGGANRREGEDLYFRSQSTGGLDHLISEPSDRDLLVFWRDDGTSTAFEYLGVYAYVSHEETTPRRFHLRLAGAQGDARLLNNDAEYGKWLTAHPAGFVANVTADGNKNYFFIHRATCHTIRPGSSRVNSEGAHTEHVYRKVVADDERTLVAWGLDHGYLYSRMSVCGVCRMGEALPDEAAEGGPRTSSGGQGRQSPRVRKAIELHAMDVVEAHLKADGWTVANESKTQPYDFFATRKNAIRYVEVKGTTGGGDAIIVTVGEVKHARAHPQETLLAIVSGIAVDETDPKSPVCSGGTLRIVEPWVPADEELEATVFRCLVRGG